MTTFSDMRKMAGFETQQALAKNLDTSRSNVNRWENGERTPNIETIQKMARLFTVSTDEIINAIISSKENR